MARSKISLMNFECVQYKIHRPIYENYDHAAQLRV